MKSRFIILLTLSVLLLSSCISLADDITPPPNYVAPTPLPTMAPAWPENTPNAANGASIFAEKCAPCHGETGLGDGPQSSQLPNPVAALGDANVAEKASPADWYTAVTKGNIESFMPPFSSLSASERWDVVAYAFSLSTSAENVALGENLYQAECAECHGEDGIGSTSTIDFREQGYMSTRSSARLAETIIAGTNTGMPPYGEKFSDEEISALTSYIRSFTFDFAIEDRPAVESVPTETTAAYTAETPLAESTLNGDEQTPAEDVAAEPTATPALEGYGTITGTVINGSGGELPSGLIVELQGYDHDVATGEFNEALVVEAPIAADGTYIFENIEMPEQRAFVTVINEGTLSYSSEPGFVTEGITTIDLPVTYYETSTDASPLSVDRLHIFFEFPDPSLEIVQVIEVFVVTNPTDYVIAPVEEGQAVLEFVLPENAENIQFEDGVFGERYTKTENGFGDTAPVSPGMGQHQIIVFFELPYVKKMDFTQAINHPISSAIAMVPQGIKLKSDMLVNSGEREAQGLVYEVYASQPLPIGATLTMNISGKVASNVAVSESDSQKNIIIGAVAFGIVLIGAGLWYFKRSQREEDDDYYDDEVEFDDAEQIMDAIIALDDAYRAGDLGEEAYKKRRADLKTQLKELV